MFYGPMSDSTGTNEVIHIEDIDEEAFRVLIRFLYTEKVDLNGDNVVRVLYAANKYGVTALEDVCGEFLDKGISEDHVHTILESAMYFRKEDLREECLDFIGHRSSILKTEGFLDIKKECFSLILQRNELDMSEEDVYQYAVDWAKRECGRTGIAPESDNIRKVLGTDTYHIRFPVMNSKFFADNIASSGVLTADECVDVFKLMVGSTSHDMKFIKSCRKHLQYRCIRFQKHMDHAWGKPTSSGIKFSIDRAILMVGILLYDCNSTTHTQSINVNVNINDSHGTCILNESKCNANNNANNDVNTHTYTYLLQQPIMVKPDSPLDIIVKTNTECICFGVDGQENVMVKDIKFSFSDSSSGNLTTTKQGQIPGILFNTI